MVILHMKKEYNFKIDVSLENVRPSGANIINVALNPSQYLY